MIRYHLVCRLCVDERQTRKDEIAGAGGGKEKPRRYATARVKWVYQ